MNGKTIKKKKEIIIKKSKEKIEKLKEKDKFL